MSETEISQDVLDEGLSPESSQDYFEFLGKKVQIKPLQVRFQTKFSKELRPFAMELATDLNESGSWLVALSGSLDHYELLPKLIQILCHNDEFMVTDEEMGKSYLQPEDMVSILMQFARKNQTIGKPIADFFTVALPEGTKELLGVLEHGKRLLKEIPEGLEQILVAVEETAKTLKETAEKANSIPTA